MLPEYYEFQNSAKILSGNKAIDNIAYELKSLGACKPMVLSGPHLAKIGTLQSMVDALESNGTVPGAIFTDIPSDSSVTVVNTIADLYHQHQCDSLIAVGGGSVLDTAKGVVMMIAHNARDLMELQGAESMTRGHHVPFIAVPTTSGTGSEVTSVAVIKNVEKSLKMEFISQHILPDVAVLDPEMTIGLPPKSTASTGFDSLCHAIEAYSCAQKNPLSDAYATAAIELIRDNLVQCVRDGKDEKARLAMANASLMAGAAFSNSMVGIVHAIGHALGAVCHVPHGDAMAILLPYCMCYNMSKLKADYSKLLLYIEGPEIYAKIPKKQRAMEAVHGVKRLQLKLHKLCNLPITLREVKVTEADFDQIVKTALNDGALLVNPVAADYDDIMHILVRAY